MLDEFLLLAEQEPTRVALRGAATVSYGQLADRALRAAHVVEAAGVAPGEPVCVACTRGPDLIAALLGALAAGACYVALEPAHPLERLRELAARSGAAITLTDDPERLRATAWPTAVVSPRDWEDAPRAVPRAGATAYVSFTSGSTGVPKGVVVGRAAVERYLGWCDDALPRSGGGVPLVASASFDHAVTCIFPPLRWGEPLTLCGEIEGGRALARELLTGHDYSFVKLTPSHLRMLTVDERAELGRRAQLVMLGGEACPPELVTDLRRDRPRLAVMNHYGPTEATVGCCVHELAPGASPDPVPIGFPLPGVRVRIAAPAGADADEGELLVGGDCLADGYLGDQQATDAAFRVDADGLRWYATGDLVARGEAGALVFRGRVDAQVKLLGHRVDPAEVVRTLERHEAVASAHVAAVADGRVARLVAAVTPAGCSEPELRRFLLDRLPASHVPATILTLDALPVTVNGKCDERALLSLADARADATAGAVAEGLRRTWGELLGLAVVDDDADFFEAGGDSLAAVGLVEWLRDAAGVEIDVIALFERPTLAAFTELVDETLRTGAAA